MLDGLQYSILKCLAPAKPNGAAAEPYQGRNKTRILLGEKILERLRGKTVLDFGCGEGRESIELAQSGVARVIGLDNRPAVLERARYNATAAGVADKCAFVTDTTEKIDAIISLDAFEHFGDPPGVLKKMYQLLPPGGQVFISFGPTWYHPRGGHLFSVIPWAHVIFSEKALIRWRNDVRNDGATRFSEVDGGLNQMTIRRFEQLVRESDFEVVSIETSPIRKLRFVHNRLTREFFTAVVRCNLVKR